MKTAIELKTNPNDFEQSFILDCQAVDRYLDDVKNTFILISWRLRDMKDHFAIQNSGYKNIYDFAEDRFGIGRTTTKNLLTIADRFTEHCHLLPKYTDFNYSQLAELASVADDEINKYTPDMTIKQIRELKKNGQTSDQNSPIEELCNAPYVSNGYLSANDKAFRLVASDEIGSRHGQISIKDVLPSVEIDEIGVFNTYTLEGGEYVAVATCGNKYYKKLFDNEPKEINAAFEEDLEAAIVEEIDGTPDEISDIEPDDITFQTHSTAEENTTNGLDYLLKKCQTSDQSDKPAKHFFSNRKEREDFIKDYKAWGLWKELPELKLKFYRYVFANGAILIATEYPEYRSYLSPKWITVSRLSLILEEDFELPNSYGSGCCRAYDLSGTAPTYVIDYMTKKSKEI